MKNCTDPAQYENFINDQQKKISHYPIIKKRNASPLNKYLGFNEALGSIRIDCYSKILRIFSIIFIV